MRVSATKKNKTGRGNSSAAALNKMGYRKIFLRRSEPRTEGGEETEVTDAWKRAHFRQRDQ